MSRGIIAFPHVTVPDEAMRWGEWQLVDPAAVSMARLGDSWDYGQDLHFGVSLDLDTDALLEAVGQAHLNEVRLVGEAVCRSSAWRTCVVAPLVRPTDFQSRSYASVRVPVLGDRVDEELALTAYLTGPGRGPEANGPVTPGAKLAIGPMSSIGLVPAADQFPISSVSFTQVDWPNAPWRFVVHSNDLSDSYKGSVRLYLNADLEVSKELMVPGDGRGRTRLLATVRFDVLRSLLQQLQVMYHDENIRSDFQEAAQMSSGSLGAVAERLCKKFFGYGLLTTMDQLDSRPSEIELWLAESVGYYADAEQV